MLNLWSDVEYRVKHIILDMHLLVVRWIFICFDWFIVYFLFFCHSSRTPESSVCVYSNMNLIFYHFQYRATSKSYTKCQWLNAIWFVKKLSNTLNMLEWYRKAKEREKKQQQQFEYIIMNNNNSDNNNNK